MQCLPRSTAWISPPSWSCSRPARPIVVRECEVKGSSLCREVPRNGGKALRDACRTLRRGEEWHVPYHWAGIVLIGDG